MRPTFASRVFAVVALLTFTSPLFFQIYRTMAFGTTPRDDYAPYLIALTGDGGEVPGSPMVYRVFSVAVALPFYLILPTYRFSNLRNIDPAYLRATQALALVSYLAVVGIVIVVYLSARKHLRTSVTGSAFAATLGYLCMRFIGEVGVDPLAILLVALLLYHLDNARIFVPLVVLSAATNEKVVFVWTLFFGIRLVFARHSLRTLKLQAGASFVAFVGFLTATTLLNVKGIEQQNDPTRHFGNILDSLRATVSLKGFYLNTSGLLVLALVCAAAWLFHAHRPDLRYRPIDVLVAGGMVLVGMIFDVDAARGWSTGRIAMHSVPLYLPLLALTADAWFRNSRARSEDFRLAPTLFGLRGPTESSSFVGSNSSVDRGS